MLKVSQLNLIYLNVAKINWLQPLTLKKCSKFNESFFSLMQYFSFAFFLKQLYILQWLSSKHGSAILILFIYYYSSY